SRERASGVAGRTWATTCSSHDRSRTRLPSGTCLSPMVWKKTRAYPSAPGPTKTPMPISACVTLCPMTSSGDSLDMISAHFLGLRVQYPEHPFSFCRTVPDGERQPHPLGTLLRPAEVYPLVRLV